MHSNPDMMNTEYPKANGPAAPQSQQVPVNPPASGQQPFVEPTPAATENQTPVKSQNPVENLLESSGIANAARKVEGAGDYVRHTILSHVERVVGNKTRADEAQRLAHIGMEQMTTGKRQQPVTTTETPATATSSAFPAEPEVKPAQTMGPTYTANTEGNYDYVIVPPSNTNTQQAGNNYNSTGEKFEKF